MSNSMNINRLPAPTFRWLAMNDTCADAPREMRSCDTRDSFPEGITKSDEGFQTRGIPTGIGEEFDELIERSQQSTACYTIAEDLCADEPIRIDYDLKEGSHAAPVYIRAERNSQATVIVSYLQSEVKEAALGSQLRIDICENARLKLVLCDLVSGAADVFCDIGTNIARNASFELVQLFLSGRSTYVGCRSELAEDGAAMEADIAYHKAGSELLDMNYIANHTGKRTTCRMDASGVMRDTSKKIFRGTIDFKRGACGAKGSENEDVLLIDDGVINQTIPLILCQEEDVEGAHGATIGRLSEDVMFYLQSRGMSVEHIYKMMARARIDMVAQKTGDVITMERIDEFFGGRKDE